MKIKIKLATEGAQMPKRADIGSAGFDLYTSEDCIVKAFQRVIVPTGLQMSIPFGWEGHIRPRSGFSAKGIEDNLGQRQDADVLQGTIDSSYRGLVGIIVRNDSYKDFIIEKGTRLAQIVFEQCYQDELIQVDTLDETERGAQGFGHSGKN